MKKITSTPSGKFLQILLISIYLVFMVLLPGAKSQPIAIPTLITACDVPPSGLTTSNIVPHSAMLLWTAVSDAQGYRLQWKNVSSATWTTVTGISTASYVLTNLVPGTTYTFQIATGCPGAYGNYSLPASFTTQFYCDIPVGLAASNITSTAADLSFAPVALAINYAVQWQPANSNTWNTINGLTSPFYHLTGLSAGVAYNFRAAALCGQGSISSSLPISFTTAVASTCNAPTGLTASGVTNSSAMLKWTAVPGTKSYTLKGTSSFSNWTITGLTAPSHDAVYLRPGEDYTIQVFAVCDAGTSASSTPLTFTTACNAPTGLTTWNVTTTSVSVYWTPSTGAQAYRIDWKASSSTAWTTLSNYPGTFITLNNLSPGAEYTFKVSIMCASGPMYSNTLIFTTNPLCNAVIPAGLMSSNITATSANLSWNAVAGAQGYSLQWKTATSSVWTTVPALTTASYVLGALTPGTIYMYQVAVKCGTTLGNYSAPTAFTTMCAAPTSLGATSVSNISANLSWTAIPVAQGYSLQWKSAASSVWTTLPALTNASYTLGALTPGTTYMFRVAVKCGTTYGNYSAPTTFTTLCNPATGLVATGITNISANLSWATNPVAQSYSLQWKTATSTVWTTVPALTAPPYTLPGLTPGTAYMFKVAVKCGATYGNYSAPTTFTTSCSAPIGLAVSAITNTSANLSWTAIPGAQGYSLQWKAAASTVWTTLAGLITATRSLTGLAPGTAYSFRVAVKCGSGYGNYSLPVTFTTNISCGVNVPTGLVSSNITSASAKLSWTATTGAKGYNLQWKDAASSVWITVPNLTAPGYVLTGLTPATVYTFRVSFKCGSGSGNYSIPSSFTTTCNTPAGLTTGSITATSAILSWTAISGATGYSVLWKTAASNVWTNIASPATASLGIYSLIPGTAYNFKVALRCGPGYGAYSAPATFTTSCSAPLGLIARSITTTSAILSWTAIAGAQGYSLQWKAASSAAWNTVSGLTIPSFIPGNLTPGTAYVFQVALKCGAGYGSYSAPATFATLVSCASIPAGLKAANITATSADLSWTAIAGAQGYTLQWKDGASTVWNTVAGLSNTFYSLGNLLPGTLYSFKVSVVCGSAVGNYSAPAVFTTMTVPQACDMPTISGVKNITQNSARISWTSLPGRFYKMELVNTSGTSSSRTITNIAGSPYDIPGLLPNTSYSVQVAIMCGLTNGPWSYAVSFTTCSNLIPNGLIATSLTSTSAILTWDIPSTANNSASILQWKTVSAPAWDYETANIKTNYDPVRKFYQSFKVTNLLPGIKYYYRAAFQCSGKENFSDLDSFITCIGSPYRSYDLTISNITTTSAHLTWPEVPVRNYSLIWGSGKSLTMDTVINIAFPLFSFSNLSPSTTYIVSVGQRCGYGYGNFSDPKAFDTKSPAPLSRVNNKNDQDSNVNNLTIRPNPVIGKKLLTFYRLADNGRISIKVMDINGRLVQIENVGYQQRGAHTFSLNIKNRLNAGNYFIIIEQNNQRIAHKQFVVAK